MESLGADWGRRPAIKQSLMASERPDSKRFFRYFTVFGRPATPFRGCGAPGAAPARRSVPNSFTRHPRPPRTVKTINSSRWRGLKRESEHRLEPMEGSFFFQNSLPLAALPIQIIGSNRYAGPNRSTGCHGPSTVGTGVRIRVYLQRTTACVGSAIHPADINHDHTAKAQLAG
jgi:hypothetical protein